MNATTKNATTKNATTKVNTNTTFDANPINLDKLNNDRIIEAKMKIASAIRSIAALPELIEMIGCENIEDKRAKEYIKKIALASISVDCAHEITSFACRHYDWNDDVCFLMDDAISNLGNALASCENSMIGDETACYIQSALAKLGRVIATLEVWFDDEEN